MSEFVRCPEAGAAAIWNWKAAQVERIESNAGSLRKKGVIQGVVAYLIAATFWYFEFKILATVATVLGSVFLLSALLSPTGVFLMLDRGAIKLGLFLGNAIRWTFIPLVYYLFFLPFGKLFRQGRKDTMKRFYLDDSDSYWEEREIVEIPTGSRRRQF